MGWKDWVYGDLVSAADFQSLVQDQTVQRYTNSAARTSALGSAVAEGMVSYLDDTNSVEVYNGSAWTGISSSGSGNAIINGGMDIWQRGTSLASGGYLADRWLLNLGGDTGTQSQQTFTPGSAPVAGYESQFFLRAVTTPVTGASNFAQVLQKIEDVRTFAGQTVTLSYFAKADSAKSIAIELQQLPLGSANVNTFVAKQALTTSWTRYTHTVTIPSVAGKTINPNNYLDLRFWLSAGSSFDARTGNLGQQGITFDLWGVQLESGTSATPFRRNANSLQGELAACQRYYWRSGGDNIYERIAEGFYTTTTIASIVIFNPVSMRVSPVSIEYSTLGLFDGPGVKTVTSVVQVGGGKNSFAIEANIASGGTAYRPLQLTTNNSTSGYFGVSAEL